MIFERPATCAYGGYKGGLLARVVDVFVPDETHTGCDLNVRRGAGTMEPMKTRWISWSSFAFALLQSLCTAVLTISGVRVLIGLGALAAAAGTDAPAAGWHRDAIRIPMMLLALAGTLVNLYVIWRVRRLRSRPSSQWRVQPRTAKEVHSERWQLILAGVTLVLLGLEWWTHGMMHHPPHHGWL